MYQRIDGERLGKMLLEIPLEFRIGTLYRQIADHLEKMILAGSIPCGARLPGTRELARTEGVFAGFSSGANVCAAIKLLQGQERGKNIVLTLNDSGLKYLSTDLYEDL